jgi:hypothetical protein
MTQLVAGKQRLGCNFAWLFSRQFDLLVFILPILFVSAVVSVSTSALLIATAGVFTIEQLFPHVGAVHSFATNFHYLDGKNRAHFFGTVKGWFIYLVVPVVLLIAPIWGMMHNCSAIVSFVYVLWTVQHLTQQNVGILLLYHNPGEAVVPRNMEVRGQQVSAASMLTVFMLHPYASKSFSLIMTIACVVFTLIICRNYVRCLLRMAHFGRPINVPALLFWLLSVWFFLPLLLLPDDYVKAMAGPLFVHWCQYIGLNCMVFSRKYTDDSATPPLLRRPIRAFIIWSLVLGSILFAIAAAPKVLHLAGWENGLIGMVAGLSLLHYFQDCFIWRFRDPFPRATLLPFLKYKQSSLESA